MKKLLALVASFCVALSFSLPVFADTYCYENANANTWIPTAQPLYNYGIGTATYQYGTWYYQDLGFYSWGSGDSVTWTAGASGNSVFLLSAIIQFGFVPYWNIDGNIYYGRISAGQPTNTQGTSTIFMNMNVGNAEGYISKSDGSGVQVSYGIGITYGTWFNNIGVDASSRFRPNHLQYVINDTLWKSSGSNVTTRSPSGFKAIMFLYPFDPNSSSDDIIAAINDANIDINQGLDDFQNSIDGWGSGAVNPGADDAITSADSALGDLNSSEDVYWEQINTQIGDLDFSITDISALSAGLTYIGNIFMMTWNTDLRTPIVLSLMLGLVLLVIGRGVRFQAAARRSERRERNNRTGGDP